MRTTSRYGAEPYNPPGMENAVNEIAPPARTRGAGTGSMLSTAGAIAGNNPAGDILSGAGAGAGIATTIGAIGAGTAAAGAGAGAAAATGAAAGSIVPGVGTLIGAGVGAAVGLTKALFTYYGNKKQEAENKRVENMNIAMYEKDEAKRAKADAWMKEYQAKKDAEARELMKFNKVQGFMDNLSSLMREKPKLQANLVNSWNSRSR